MSSEKKQKLTKAELRRKETFEKMAEGLAAEGYTQKILKLNFVEINVLTLLIAIPFMIPFLAAFRLFGNEFTTDGGVSVSEYDISKTQKEKTLLFTLM